MTGPNLYDLLNVAESSSPEQIRAAWKAAIADLDPTDRRLQAYNDAGAVLLDAEKRSAYDAQLAEERDEQTDGASATSPVVASAADVVDGKREGTATDRPDVDKSTDGVVRSGPASWAMWTLAVAAALSLALGVFTVLAVTVLDNGDRAQSSASAEQNGVDGKAAVAAATGTIAPLFGYDYRTMDEDLARFQGQMTDSMADRQAASWPALTKEAKQQKIVVTAQAPYAGLTRISEDGARATVVVFLDQQVKKQAAEPFTLRMWATLTLVRQGDRWLLDDVCTEGECG